MPKLAKWHTQEDKQNLKEAMLEQAINNIMEDPDRIEKYIQENADVFQEIIWRNGGYENISGIKKMSIESCIGAEILANVLLGIENMADEDVEDAMR